MGREILTPLENIAARWVVEHPEYHAELSNEAAALDKAYLPDAGKTNPFLHLSMHMTISDQVQVNQPVGVTPAYQSLLNRMGDPHSVHHAMMECLGEMLWNAQSKKAPPDGDAYVAALQRL